MSLRDVMERRARKNPVTLNAWTMKTLMQKLKEPSTWRGIGLVAGLVGINLDDEVWSLVGEIVVAGLGIWEIVRRERAIPKAEVVE